jgi:hypothetical protein
VYIAQRDKISLTADWKHKPLELMRRLFRNIIGETQLAQMAGKGHGQYKAIPPHIYEAVRGNSYIFFVNILFSIPNYFSNQKNS